MLVMPFLLLMTENGKFLPPMKMVMTGRWFMIVPTFILCFLLNFPHFDPPKPVSTPLYPLNQLEQADCAPVLAPDEMACVAFQPKKMGSETHLFSSLNSLIISYVYHQLLHVCYPITHIFRQIATMAWFTIRDVTHVDKMSRVTVLGDGLHELVHVPWSQKILAAEAQKDAPKHQF